MPAPRHLTALTATTALVAALTFAPPVASGSSDAVAQDSYGPQSKITVGVGADESGARFNWTTEGGGVEYLQIASAAEGLGSESTQEVASEGAYFVVLPAGIHSHRAEVDGLAENTDYVYRLGSEEHGWSEPEEFSTGTYGDSWNFLVYGDPQIGAGDTATDAVDWRRTVTNSLTANPDPAFLLSVGDQVDYPDFYHEYEGFFSPEELDNHRLAVVNGNHDVLGVNQAHSHLFNEPNMDAFGTLEPHNYYFEHNNALVVALDTNFSSAEDIAEQKAFLRQTVAAHEGEYDWLIVTYHHSTYSQAYHQTDGVVQAYRREMTDVFSNLGVDIVFGGHDHIHTRSHLMNGPVPVEPDGETGPGDVLTPAANEVLYYTATSSSGSKFYDFSVADGGSYEEYPEITTMEQSDAAGLTAESTAYWIQDHTPDYTTVEVTPTTMVVTTRNAADGTLVDQVTLDRTPPTVPTETSTAQPPRPTGTTTSTVSEPELSASESAPTSTVTVTAEPSEPAEPAEPAPSSLGSSSGIGAFITLLAGLGLGTLIGTNLPF